MLHYSIYSKNKTYYKDRAFLILYNNYIIIKTNGKEGT